jgi:hypothetical protein
MKMESEQHLLDLDTLELIKIIQAQKDEIEELKHKVEFWKDWYLDENKRFLKFIEDNC